MDNINKNSRLNDNLTNEQRDRLNIIAREGKLTYHEITRIICLAGKGDSESISEIDSIILKHYVGE